MIRNIWLGTRSVAMTVLFPGTVVGLIPYWILDARIFRGSGGWSLTNYLGTVVIAIGLAVLLRCIWEFAFHGKGTLAPFDEPRKLVVQGLYKYVRNPMYVGVVTILLGESLHFWSGRLALYTSIIFVAANVLIVGYEELRLRSKFGNDYERYCAEVGRWIPGKPYSETD